MQNKPQKIIYIPKVLNENTIPDTIFELNEFIESSENSLVLSFHKTVNASPSGLTPLLCFLRDISSRKPNFQGKLVGSNDENIENTIARMGFYELLGIDDELAQDAKRFKELYCFSSSTPEVDEIKVNEQIIYSFVKKSNNDNFKKTVTWCINELVDNARTHSQSQECVLFAQKQNRGNFTEFCIADCGLGIQATMGDNDIITALKRCVSPEKGINSEGMGNGLYYTTELIKNDKSENKSYLTIWSGNAKLRVVSGDDPIIENTKSNWQGTVVTLSLSDNIESSIELIKKGMEVTLTEDLPNFLYQLEE